MDASTVCASGQSIACVGPGGCSGGQACKTDGSGYESCQCGSVSDGGGDSASGDAGDGAVGWKPSALGASLSLWLEADVGVKLAGPSTKWSDQSGNGNDATRPNTPLPDPKMGTTSGHAVLQFDSGTSALQIADAPSLQFPNDFAVELVVDSASSGGFLYSKVPSGPPNGMQMNLAGGPSNPAFFINNPYVLNGSVGAGTSLADGKLHMLGVRRSGITCEVRVDGVATAGQSGACSSVLVNASGSPVMLARSYDGANGSVEDYAEIVAVKGTLSDGDVAKLEAYFKSKYGL